MSSPAPRTQETVSRVTGGGEGDFYDYGRVKREN